MKPPEPEKPCCLDSTKPQQEKDCQQNIDPFYIQHPEKPLENIEEPDYPTPSSPSLEDEMPGAFGPTKHS